MLSPLVRECVTFRMCPAPSDGWGGRLGGQRNRRGQRRSGPGRGDGQGPGVGGGRFGGAERPAGWPAEAKQQVGQVRRRIHGRTQPSRRDSPELSWANRASFQTARAATNLHTLSEQMVALAQGRPRATPAAWATTWPRVERRSPATPNASTTEDSMVLPTTPHISPVAGPDYFCLAWRRPGS